MNKDKWILAIGGGITAIILIFTAVFLYFGSKDIADLEKQLKNANKERGSLTTETTRYESALASNNVEQMLKEVKSAGEDIATIQNNMTKDALERMNPIDAAGAYTYSDKSALKRMQSYFPNENEMYTNNAWFLSEKAKCEFNTVFEYNAAAVPVVWTTTVSNRVIGLATAKYNVEKRCFEDLVLYTTMFGDVMNEGAYNSMVDRVNGNENKTPAIVDDNGEDVVGVPNSDGDDTHDLPNHDSSGNALGGPGFEEQNLQDIPPTDTKKDGE